VHPWTVYYTGGAISFADRIVPIWLSVLLGRVLLAESLWFTSHPVLTRPTLHA